MAPSTHRIQAVHTFPRGFKWGAATAAHQVEGSPPPSDWWEWEQHRNFVRDGSTAEPACEWWKGRWQEDFDRAASDGHTTHRMSLDWSRIEPRLAVWDEDALDYYRQMIVGLRKRGLEPMVTLHHFVNPLWLAERGGWTNPEAITLFERFTRKVVGALQDLVTLWCTFNEINIYAYAAYSDGTWPPREKNTQAFFQVMRHMLLAHAAAYRAIHEIQPQAQVGLAHHIRFVDPLRPTFAPDRWVAGFQHRTFNTIVPEAVHTGRLRFPVGNGLRGEILPELANTQDFVGVNYYTRQLSRFDPALPAKLFGRLVRAPEAEVDSIAFNELYPEGLFRVLKWAAAFGKPIYVTENGWGDDDESRRSRAMVLHLRKLWQSTNFNWPIKGYYYWSLVDNFEWERGWTHRFGLYAVDVETQVRTPRPAARLYAEVCKTNTLTSDMVESYAPALMDSLFPG